MTNNGSVYSWRDTARHSDIRSDRIGLHRTTFLFALAFSYAYAIALGERVCFPAWLRFSIELFGLSPVGG